MLVRGSGAGGTIGSDDAQRRSLNLTERAAYYALIVIGIVGLALRIFGVLPQWSIGIAPFSYVETSLWGGLPVTLILATYGLAVAFPYGVLLALGRRSNLPLIKGLCVGFIELIRGVPLISLLIMASVMLPLFLPSGHDHRQIPAGLRSPSPSSLAPTSPRSSAAACNRCPRASSRRPTRWASTMPRRRC